MKTLIHRVGRLAAASAILLVVTQIADPLRDEALAAATDIAAKKHAEHHALLALAPPASATHVAIKSGSWFDPSSWESGEVPGARAKVVVPAGRRVVYDGESAASIFTIRVDGELAFATDRDTFLKVDTLIVAPSGKMTIGTAQDPVRPDREAVISIAANGPIDPAWDTTMVSRGVVSTGAVEIHGARKSSFARVAVDPAAEAKTITFAAVPEGWRIGDRVVVAGARLTQTGRYDQDEPRNKDYTEDEERRIVGIDGAVIALDRPLRYDHKGPRPDLKTYVANYTRNVRIETENAAALPVHERGHVMFMHSDKIDVRYAEFRELGRTDKSVRAFDLSDIGAAAPNSNLKGRYSLHIHRTGAAAKPAMIVGNSVWRSPGWGFVHHDSNAILVGNAAYDVFGAAFVAETANETGRWAENIAIKSIGVFTGPKDADDVDAFDLGRGGVGFWFQGRLVEAVGNVAAGSPGGHGFVYMTRAPADEFIPIDPKTVQYGEKLRYYDTVMPNLPNIGIFTDNEAFAVGAGLEIIKAEPQQRNDTRTVIANFKGWEVRSGVILQYTAHYTLRDIDVLSARGIDPITWPPSRGIAFETNAFDMVVNRATVEGFNHGVAVHHSSLIEGVTDFQYAFIDMTFRGNAADYHAVAPTTPPDRFLKSADLRAGAILYEPASAVVDFPDHFVEHPIVELPGWKTDSLGRTAISTVFDPFLITFVNIRGAVEANGYWTLRDGRKVALIEEYVSDRATGETEKFPLWIKIPAQMNLAPNAGPGSPRVRAVDHGLFNPANAPPIARDDVARVAPGKSVAINVLANDRDPEGRPVALDAVISERGHVIANADGTVTYLADPGFEGADVFHYWAQDDSGNFTKARVTVLVGG